MPIVFDQVDGVVEPSASSSVQEEPPSSSVTTPGGAHAVDELERQLERARRRRQRLAAD